MFVNTLTSLTQMKLYCKVLPKILYYLRYKYT